MARYGVRVDCPQCGCPAWTGLARWDATDYGDDLTCRACGLVLLQGQVLRAARDVDPDALGRIIVRELGSDAVDPVAVTYVAPEDRCWRLALVPQPASHERHPATGRGAR